MRRPHRARCTLVRFVTRRVGADGQDDACTMYVMGWELRLRGRWTLAILAVVIAAAGFAGGWIARPIADRVAERARELRVADAVRAPSAGFEIELWARTPQHPAESCLCLLDGKYGLVESNGRVGNRNSHVDFNWYASGSFTAGVQGGEQGQVIDLGDAAVLAREHGRAPLEALRWHQGELVVEGDVFLAPDDPSAPPSASPLRRWAALVLPIPAIAGNSAADKQAQVKPGHVYFVRIMANRGPSEIVALMQVLEYDVGSRVKLRCVQL